MTGKATHTICLLCGLQAASIDNGIFMMLLPDNVKIINTVMLLVKMYIMNCKYDRGVLPRVAFVGIFMYKVTLLGRLYENDVFVQLAQMFAET